MSSPSSLIDLIAGADQAHVLVFRPLLHIGADRVDRVADEHRLDEAQLVVAVGEGVDAVGGDQAEPGGEHEGAGHQAPAEHAFAGGEALILHIGMHVEHQRVECMRLALGDRPAQRTNSVPDLEILVEPVFGIPHRNVGMGLRHILGVGRRNADRGRVGRRRHRFPLSPAAARSSACGAEVSTAVRR